MNLRDVVNVIYASDSGELAVAWASRGTAGAYMYPLATPLGLRLLQPARYRGGGTSSLVPRYREAYAVWLARAAASERRRR